MDCGTESACSACKVNNELQETPCESLPQLCRPPRKDIETSIRTAPFKGYPKKFGKRSLELKSIWPDKRPEPIPVPKCSPRFYLKRIYQVLVQIEDDGQTTTDVWSLWKSYEKEAADVFVYNNADAVANIILLLSLSCQKFSEFQELFDKIMQRLQRGVYLGAASRELRDLKKFTYFFSCLGVAIVEGHLHAKTCVASIIGVWLENLINKRKTVKKARCSLTSRLMRGSKQLALRVPDYILLRTLEKSLLATTIARCINAEMQIDTYMCILSLLKLCCDASSVIRERLWCLPLLDIVFSRLAEPDPSNRILIKSTDFVYSYFGVYNMYQEEDATANVTPRLSKNAFQILVQRFIQQLETPNSPSKSLLGIRNDTAFLVCLIGKRIPFSGEYFRSYSATIASLVHNGILGINGPEDKFKIEPTTEDLELLKLMICMLKSIVEAGRGAKIIRKYKLVSVLLTLILGPCALTEKTVMIGSELESTAWSTLGAIAKQFPLFLLTQHGVASLLAVLKTFGKTGEGNQATLAMSIHTLRIMLSSTVISGEEDNRNVSDEVILYFIDREAVAIFLSVMYRLVDYDYFGALQDTMISNALFCCAMMGHGDLSQKETFVSLDGVALLIMLMHHLTRNPAEKKQVDSVMQIALAECICGCVAYYPTGLEAFLDREGVLRVLDVLEISKTPETTVQLMNCVIQLCDYPRCMDQLLCWKRPLRNATHCFVFGDKVGPIARSLLYTIRDTPKSGDNLLELETPKDLSLGAFLCSLWSEEEKRTEVLRDPEGCIASLSHPLMTKLARTFEVDNEENFNDMNNDVDKTSIDMKNSPLRPKIYLLIKRIVETSNTAATLFDGLSLINQVLMQVIMNFVDLKKSEVYTDMADAMQLHGLSFAPNDDDEGSSLVMVAKNTIATVLETQRFLIRRFKEKECMKETEFYTLVKQCRLQDHLQATREIDYMARTTNYQYLVERRLWQKRELEDATKYIDGAFLKNSRVHRTSDGYLNITTWPNRTKVVVSEPKINRNDFSLDDYEDNDEPEESIEDVDENEGGLESIKPSRTSKMPLIESHAIMSYNPSSASVMFVTENATPDMAEGGYYQISPYLLRQALFKLLSFRNQNEWINLLDDDEENRWKMLRKWRNDWYPLNRLKAGSFDEMEGVDGGGIGVKPDDDTELENEYNGETSDEDEVE